MYHERGYRNMKTKKKYYQSIAFQLLLFFLIAIIIPLLLTSLGAIGKTRSALNNNMKVTSEQTLQTAQSGFTTYLKTLSQPVDLLTRKNEVKHLEDQGDFDTNAKAVKDSLVASVKVTNGSEMAFFTTKTGKKITGWTELNESTGKTSSKGDILTSGVNDTKELWYTGCIGTPSRNSIYAAFSDPYIDKNSGKKIFTVSQEIKYSTGENYGTVGMNIDFAEVENYVGQIGLLNTGFVILVNKDGNILVNNEKNTYMQDSVTSLSCWNTIAGLTEEQCDIAMSFDEKINGKSVHVVASKDLVTGWTLVGFIDSSETQATLNQIVNSTVISAIVALVVGVLIAIFVSAIMRKEMKTINAALNNMANGDLSMRIPVRSNNEFGVMKQNYNSMVDNISLLIKDVEEKSGVLITESNKISKISETTTETVNQVTEAIQNVSEGAVGQAESTTVATGDVESLAAKLHETKAYVNDINDMSAETQNLSNRGIGIVEDLIGKGEKSKENSRISKEVVKEMIDSIEKIKFISDAITQITEQTNLLSLNASIEAARAGESGRGFSVVADEIRKLAEQSQASTDEIIQIIGEITEKSDLVSKTMDESVEIIEEQNRSINAARDLFNNISDSVNALKEGMDNIANLNEQMDKSRENVISTMGDVANVATDTAAAAQEVTASAIEVTETMRNLNTSTEELDKIAANLQDSINQFKL